MSLKSIDTLKSVAKTRLDEESRALVTLRTKQSAIQNKIADLQEATRREAEAAGEDLRLLYLRYVKTANMIIAGHERELAEMSQEVAEQEERVRTAFAEFKRFEIVGDRIRDEEKQERQKKEADEVDDVVQARYAQASNDT